MNNICGIIQARAARIAELRARQEQARHSALWAKRADFHIASAEATFGRPSGGPKDEPTLDDVLSRHGSTPISSEEFEKIFGLLPTDDDE